MNQSLYGTLLGLALTALLLSVAAGLSLPAPEICDNAGDDDGDGQIDLNDPDCDCPPLEPVSLIPNPSFEDSECCPSGRSQLNCADTWIQASEATTDYLHTCGWMGWDDLPPPLPFPDGEACVGFRNGRFGGGKGRKPVGRSMRGPACCLRCGPGPVIASSSRSASSILLTLLLPT